MSPAGDAYDLAASFGDDFSKLLVTGASPFKTLPSPPSMQRVGSQLGGAPKESACEAFGRGPRFGRPGGKRPRRATSSPLYCGIRSPVSPLAKLPPARLINRSQRSRSD